MNGDRASLVLGIDPGLQVTGYGLVRVESGVARLVEGGTIESGPSTLALGDRLRPLFDGLTELLGQSRPTAMAMEQLYSHYAHPRTALLMAHARGVLTLAASLNGVPVFDYAATQVKSSLTGNGRANKEQVQRAIRSALALNETPRPADVADALAVALCHANRMKNGR